MRLVASARTAGLCCLVLGLALGLVGTVATPARDSTRLSTVALGDGYYVITGNVEKSTNKDTQPRFRGWTSADGKKWGRLVVGDRTDTVDSEGRAVDTLGKHYQIVGTLQNNGNGWDGTY